MFAGVPQCIMGCGSSNVARIQINSKDPNFVSIIEAWDQVQATVEKVTGRGLFQGMRSNLVIRRTGWKTIRIFVSSTFKDFHQEREILVKKVFFICYSLLVLMIFFRCFQIT